MASAGDNREISLPVKSSCTTGLVQRRCQWKRILHFVRVRFCLGGWVGGWECRNVADVDRTPILPHNENTQYILHTSMLTQSTSCATKNQSGVKTCRVADTRVRQLPQVVSSNNLRPSREWKHILETQFNYMIHRKDLEKKITEPLSPKKWRNFAKIRTVGVLDSRVSDSYHIHSQVHVDDSEEGIADLEDGELQKMLTSPEIEETGCIVFT